ncbi:FAD-dependent monooxygenase [Roseixanthobacter glucoisosaccharinicivorans]|uniref:FAD-dependent monooxygenase n=1 Tax=Roseixanthobacter glucoisosaccharinicivorans TaxID=3119923 RepID=UPI00372699FC
MNNRRNILVSGASFAGLATAFWMKRQGYDVTVVEIAEGLKRGGTPVNIRGNTIDIVKRMGLFEQIASNRLHMEPTELVNADGVAERSGLENEDTDQPADEEYEIERDVLLNLMFDAVKDDVEFVFGDSISSLKEHKDGIDVSFTKMAPRSFNLVFGCDGIHSTTRMHWFGAEKEFSHFLEAYGSVSIVDKLLIRENTSQVYNEPGKAVMLSAYNNKTDIILMFFSESEIAYDYRDEEQKRRIIFEQFSGVGWRTQEILRGVKQTDNFYFDVLSQIKMPSWTKGRVALVGDAAYCASPAAGMGGSLAIDGAAALAAAFEKCGGDHELAFQEYNESFRPFIEQAQADAVSFGIAFLVPRTVEAIRKRSGRATSS